MDKSYEPKLVEEKWSQFWKDKKLFQADPHSSKPPYSIVIPPPNVTGVLHMGHALVNTLQDILIRWKRMCGFEALWVPGTDHAGIATQTVVERHLMATEKKRRKDYSREEFLARVWKWKEESEHQILKQISLLGCSCDWSRLAFTMDEPRTEAVLTCFQKMYDAGLIYRGDYLVNWDPVTQTALADDEVEYEERETKLWHIRYPLEDRSGHIVIATTRPETLLGDVAVAVSMNDLRYQSFVGKNVILPIVSRLIPVIADPHIDPLFGTGAMKVTPAHDPNDYEMAQRHPLAYINILTPDGKINQNGGEFQGLSTEEARIAVVKKLEALGLLEKAVPYTYRVGVSYRSKAVIEPYLSKQWFVKLTHFKQPLIDAVQTESVRLLPDHFKQTYLHWIHNLRDWCISRQLWWGHRIPIWYSEDKTVCYTGEGLPPEARANPSAWKQDEDVLDTWFSSALWPLSVFGWPEKTPDLERFYPTSTLVTGHDILFFWVARMVMMGEYLTDEAPFRDVFLHGLIYGKSYWRFNEEGAAVYTSAAERLSYDMGKPVPPEVQSKWEKMSKSKGNVIDPIEMIESFGADAVRMALCASATEARQIDLDRRRFEEYKNFANKIWNAARFVFMNLEGISMDSGINRTLLTLEDRWILSRLGRVIWQVSTNLLHYAFDKAALSAYDFFWKEFCAYYVEISKPILFGKAGTSEEKANKQKILFVVLTAAVRLLHPMAPFITEELFSLLKKFSSEKTGEPYTDEALSSLQAAACATAPYPKVIRETDIDSAVEEAFASIDAIVHAIRNIRAEMQLPPGIATDVYLVGSCQKEAEPIIKALVRLNQLHFVEADPVLPFASAATLPGLKIFVPMPGEMREKEKARLLKEQEKLIQQQNIGRSQLANPDFVAKAPPELVTKIKNSLAQSDEALIQISRKIQTL